MQIDNEKEKEKVYATVVVCNLSDGREIHYGPITRSKAVICAYAQSLNDWNTWDYEKKYKDKLEYGKYTISIGDWTTMNK